MTNYAWENRNIKSFFSHTIFYFLLTISFTIGSSNTTTTKIKVGNRLTIFPSSLCYTRGKISKVVLIRSTIIKYFFPSFYRRIVAIVNSIIFDYLILQVVENATCYLCRPVAYNTEYFLPRLFLINKWCWWNSVKMFYTKLPILKGEFTCVVYISYWV